MKTVNAAQRLMASDLSLNGQERLKQALEREAGSPIVDLHLRSCQPLNLTVTLSDELGALRLAYCYREAESVHKIGIAQQGEHWVVTFVGE